MLSVQHLIGFGAGRRNLPPVVTWTGSDQDGTNLTTYTFTAVPIGAADGARLVIAMIEGNSAAAAAGQLVASGTIGGITADVHGGVAGAAPNESSVTCLTARVPTGTTADIVVTFAGAQVRAGVDAFTIYGQTNDVPVLSSAETASGTVTDVAVSVGPSQAGVAASMANVSASRTCTWTNASETSDRVVETNQANASSATIAADIGAVNVTATWTGSANSIATLCALWD